MRWSVRVALWAALLSLVGGAARADVASDQAGAILVFPKIFVDTQNEAGRGRVDTLIRISNTNATQPISLRCFYTDATPSCSNNDGTCLWPNSQTALGCTGTCETPLCQETDFVINITARQPIAWLASQGERPCSQTPTPGVPCFQLTGDGVFAPNGQSNAGSLIPNVPQDPFLGQLKCVAVDRNDVPVERNDLKGEVEIVRVDVPVSPVTPTTTDVESYNAIGIPAIANTNNGDNTLMLGGNQCRDGVNAQKTCSGPADCPGSSCVSVAEYSGCPNVLILDHFFDGAHDPVLDSFGMHDIPVTTILTVVPCSEDYLNQAPVATTVQFLVFNEFEQRFSTSSSRPVSCLAEWPIWKIINTQTPDRSIFSAAAAGTLTGQTRIWGVADKDTRHGHGLLGVAEEFRAGGGAAAFNLHFGGSRPQGDLIYVP